MSGAAYYNENDPAAAHVLRSLIADGLIASGEVDDRSIKEVHSDDLRGYTQVHWFAGMGGWSVAARLAGWPDDRPLWTASCPCQPFSAAGKGRGTNDPRHLWPDLFRLVSACRPAVLVGEQVSGAPGYGWLDGIRADLATEGYASEAVDIPACAVDAPHQRNRLYWIAVGDRDREGLAVGSIAEVRKRNLRQEGQAPCSADDGSSRYGNDDLADTGNRSTGGGRTDVFDEAREHRARPKNGDVWDSWRGPVWRNGSFYADAEWIACHDGKARRTKPGLCLLAHGLVGRIDWWRLAGNGIVLPLAAEVIGALMDVLDERRTAA